MERGQVVKISASILPVRHFFWTLPKDVTRTCMGYGIFIKKFICTLTSRECKLINWNIGSLEWAMDNGIFVHSR